VIIGDSVHAKLVAKLIVASITQVRALHDGLSGWHVHVVVGHCESAAAEVESISEALKSLYESKPLPLQQALLHLILVKRHS
jgi:hypothetical protein